VTSFGPTPRSTDGVDLLIEDARLATLVPTSAGLGVVDGGAIAIRDGKIVYAGARADMPTAFLNATATLRCDGRWITPGLVDCHTHLVYAGNRAREFEQRLAGATYEEIARAGGGIVSTVNATRAATLDQLVAQTLPRLDALMAEGVTTVEIKSGYGLDLATETRHPKRPATRIATSISSAAR
jgi:imidazolonepropionase